MFFGNNEEKKTGTACAPGAKQVNSALGREITTVENAKQQFYKPSTRRDPRDHVNKIDGLNYYGHTFADGEDVPMYIPDSETTHEIYIGSTGTGKGVFIGNRVLEAIQRKLGVIIIDPKQDVFAPQIALEELTRQGRPEDLQVLNWPSNFPYSSINKDDTAVEIANKLVDALNLGETGEPGVDYYSRNSRVLLKKVLNIFLSGALGYKIEKDLAQIVKHVRHLKEDLEKEELLNKELSKTRPLPNLVLKYEKRFFKKERVEAIYWDSTTVETLDALSKSLAEITEAGNISNKFSIDGALYESKVLYVKCDMLDIASLKLVKALITDAIQRSRRKRASTVIIADEISFYANKTLSGALATVRSMGLKFLLALQDLAQMEPGVREAILSNCNVKLFYKISDKETFDYVERVGGQEAVTKYRTGEGGYAITQDVEPLLNATKIRALPRAGVGILIAEYLNTPKIIQTSFVATERQFDWLMHEDNEYYAMLENGVEFEDEEEESFEISKVEETEENGDEEDF